MSQFPAGMYSERRPETLAAWEKLKDQADSMKEIRLRDLFDRDLLAQKMLDSNVVSIDQAVDIIAGHLRKPGTELVPIRQANHRVVADEISPCLDHPQGDVALVDGFALEASQTEGASEGSPAIFTVVGEVGIGETPGFSLRRGECASVSTGCFLPQGADAVIGIEEIGDTGQQIRVKRKLTDVI